MAKAIVGAAYGFENPDEGPLSPDQFSAVARLLHELGFTVVFRAPDGSETPLERLSASKLVAAIGKEAKVAADQGEFDPDNIDDARERYSGANREAARAAAIPKKAT